MDAIDRGLKPIYKIIGIDTVIETNQTQSMTILFIMFIMIIVFVAIIATYISYKRSSQK